MHRNFARHIDIVPFPAFRNLTVSCDKTPL